MKNYHNTNHSFSHLFLIEAGSEEEALLILMNFVNGYELIRYEEITFQRNEILVASKEKFWIELERALEANRKILSSLIDEIKNEGYVLLDDLKTFPQGYLSKLLHTLAHIIDGFFGIDSFFYNLVEDSHFISHVLLRKIRENPQRYYLLPWIGHIKEPMRRFEVLNPKKFIK
ncbi:MAG: hypothetical protein N2Z40_04190 [Caldimicrobium sp.]|nr:hypothetical protein [Caldimicrobium sp.]MCX7613405.1 hypothetical protein [Caldimicrobium sp.]MDW8182385.1 hypothetical protein [Caldimicrobium sp.]